MLNLNNSLDELKRHIRAGNVAAGEDLLNRLGDTLRTTWPKETLQGMTATTSIAELQFVLGHDDQAKHCLDAYADPQSLLATPLPARHKLQVAEYHYSSLRLPKAIAVGEQVLAEARSKDDLAGMAEAHFYLARFRLRDDAPIEANQHCMAGLECLLRAPAESSEDQQAVRWQTGRLLRVRGAALWQQAYLQEAKAVLYLSCWILRDAFGDAESLHVGDALLSLGRLLRSDSVLRHEEAIAMLEEAKKHYADHELKLARALIDLARTRHNMALASLRSAAAGADNVADELFDASRRDLDDAMAIITEKCRGHQPPKVWRRQRAEAHLWRCWIALESRGKDRNPKRARRDAEFALNEAIDIGSRRSDLVEAKIALGHTEMELDDHVAARTWFEDALGQAEELEHQSPKLLVHVHLSLAQLECRSGGSPETAQRHLNHARAAVGSGSEISSYLTAKTASVQTAIEKLARSRNSLVLSPQDLKNVPDGMAPLEALEVITRGWALDSVGKDVSIEEAAKALKTSKGTISEIKKRSKKFDEALKRAKP